MSWAKEAMRFAMATLPDLLTKYGEERVEDAFKELGQKFSDHRSAQMRSRKDEVAENRRKIDEELEVRPDTPKSSGKGSKSG